jgi:S1-C subfamily serine protease
MNVEKLKQAVDRRLLFVLLGVSAAVFAFVSVSRSLLDHRDEAARVEAESGMMAGQRLLSRRLTELQDQSRQDISELQSRISSLAGDQQTGATLGPAAPSPGIERVVGAIVELICIDNINRGVYYTASGTVVDKSGLIVTNRHTLRSADGSTIRYCGVGFTSDLREPPKVEYVAETHALHESSDLAILKISERLDGDAIPESFPAVSLIGSKDGTAALSLGDAVYIGGYPGIGAETFTVTEGVVSGRVGSELIKTSALIDMGTSGGAAFDSVGVFIGVPTAAAKGEIGGSLGYLIGADVVDGFLADYLAAKTDRPF